jgi:hypothetical protein
MSGAEEDMKKQIESILRKLSAEEQEILWKVIKAERDKLHMKNPRGINEDIGKAITEIIK